MTDESSSKPPRLARDESPDASWREWFARWEKPIHRALAVGAICGVASLLLEYGFRGNPPLPRFVLAIIQTLVIVLFVTDSVVRLLAAKDRRRFLLDHWLDASLVVFLVGGALLAGVLTLAGGTESSQPLQRKLVSYGAIFVIIAQLYLGLHVCLHGLRAALQLGRMRMRPGQWIVLTFAGAIMVGSLLLMLPSATAKGQPAIDALDALFTSTSAVCVTGLIVVDTGTHFSSFGLGVILVLIQLGGLGIMTFGAFAALLIGRGLGLRGSAMMQDVLNYEMVGRIKRMLKFVVILTFVAEAIGVFLLWNMWEADLGFGERLFKSVFHSISAFCNAGFSLQGDSLLAYNRTWQVHAGFTGLIILGGLGFPVLSNLWVMGADRLRRRFKPTAVAGPPLRLNLHSKLVLSATVVLLLVGTGIVFCAEGGFVPPKQTTKQTTEATLARIEQQRRQRTYLGQNATNETPLAPSRIREMPWPERLREAWFFSVTARTAGFNSAEMGNSKSISPASQLALTALMFIGGSPSGTAGGIKTVSVCILLLVLLSIVRRRPRTEAFGRSISRSLVRRAIAMFFVMLSLLGICTMAVCMFEPELTMAEALFEIASALGTVGLSIISTETTGALQWPTKLIIIFAMYVGRLGPMTFMLALIMSPRKGRYDYPTEPIIIG